ncbi:nucleotide sugar dehydrogenase [candidate division KSB1 bacterium]
MKRVCVLGLGYIGLPTASIFAMNGFKVLGIDVKTDIVENINNGTFNIQEPGLHTTVQAAIKSGNLKVGTSPEKADIFIIAVPTPFKKNNLGNNNIPGKSHLADLSYVQAAAEAIIPFIEKGNIIILESTSPPGTTVNFLIPILEKSGLKAGLEFFVAHCPERVLPGNILKEFLENDRIIGGIDYKSAEIAKNLYEKIVEGDIYLTDATTAEMVKLMENIYRDVNIALSNELAIISEKFNINAVEVIQLANKHPRVNLHQPGPGVGGHCISVDPWFLIEKAPELSKLMLLGRQINDDMPGYIFDKTKKLLKDIAEPKIAILGVSYKGNVDDTRESPALKICEKFREANIDFSIFDPHVKKFHFDINSLNDTLEQSDLILILADHKEFKNINPDKIKNLVKTRMVFDTKNCLEHHIWKNEGFTVILL